jgi:PAS domain S-box-containing protein
MGIKKGKNPKKQAEVRKQARSMLNNEKTSGIQNLSFDAIEKLVHELNFHKIELEMQNEELKRARMETETSLEKYSDLYEFAPVAYFTFDINGIIEETNMTGTCLLGSERHFLLQRRFRAFVEKNYQDVFFNFLYKIFNSGNKHICELCLVNKQGDSFYAELIGTPIKDHNGKVIHCRVAATDISERKKAGAIIKAALEEEERLNIILKTQEEERKRISEALHNGLGQLLYAIKLKLEKIGKSYSHILIDESKELLTEAMRDAKKISFELIPALLDDFGLEKAINELSKKYSGESLTVHCNIFGYEKRLLSCLEIAVFRIVQELLNNIVKHSKATEAQISVVITKKMILKVEDNGIGFNVKKLTKGFGLRNINYRVQLLNAEIEITSAPKKGTEVTILIPLKENGS